MKPSSITLAVSLCLASFLAAMPAALRAAETEVFRAHPPEEGKTKSGFDEKAAVRIEPTDGKSLRLNLRDLPAHQFLKVEAEVEIQATPGMEIELFMMGDGRKFDPATIERSRLQISVDGKKPTVDSSFGGYMGVGGSFPDLEGEFLHVPGTGSAHGAIKMNAAEPGAMMGLLGDFDLEKMQKLARHTVTFIVPHSEPEASIDFSWKTPDGPIDPFGGVMFGGGGFTPFSITGLKASTLDAPVAMDKEAFAQNFEALGGSDPVSAIKAMNALVAAGHDILPRLNTKLAKKPDPDLEKKFADALVAMDDPSFEKRAMASKTLTDLGNAIVPMAKNVLAEKADELSVETKSTLENLAGRIENGEAATSDHIRTNRVRRLLDTLGGKEAEALKATLPDPKIVVSPDIDQMVTALRNIVGGGIEMGFPPDGDPFAGEGEVFELPGELFEAPEIDDFSEKVEEGEAAPVEP